LLIDRLEIRGRVQELAALLRHDYSTKPRPLLVCTLKGACSFFIHLTDALQDLRQGYDIEFVRVSSYDGIQSTGQVTVLHNNDILLKSIRGRHVIIVEDIVDTGTTLATMVPLLETQGSPASLEICTLLDKRLDDTHEKKFTAKYCGFSIPNHFIIGYG
jgi:hypoxanthine phosphoribosyltransferase